MATATGGTTLSVTMGFLPADQAVPDPDHPGLLRAGARGAAPYGTEGREVRGCTATDWTVGGAPHPDLTDFGFDTVDLSPFADLQETLASVRAAGHLTDADADAVRAALDGVSLRLGSGSTVTVLYVADEGFIMRTAGPNGIEVEGPGSGRADHQGQATTVHADQDVFGTPLTQLMDGRAPMLFRHDSPDGHNHEASLMLVNLWIPLQQITQPLTFADGRTIDRRRHQLRYGLATSSFLDRSEDQVINDIWLLLYDDAQRWYLRSEMDHREAYLFDTLSTPHGAATLPGEAVAERCYVTLESAEVAIAAGDVDALTAAIAPPIPPAPDDTPAALRDAIDAMVASIDAARRDPGALGEPPAAAAWLAAARAARDRVVRRSLELRIVVSIGT